MIRTVRSAVLLGVALLGAATTSQLPEFAQQYRQRIGGAIEELGRVVAEFDRDAAQSGLTRDQALDRHAQSGDDLFRARGLSAAGSIRRHERLVGQRVAFESWPETARPFVLTNSDSTILSGTWRDFRPAIPTTTAGLVWAGAGFVTASLLGWAIGRGLRAGWRRMRHPAENHAPAQVALLQPDPSPRLAPLRREEDTETLEPFLPAGGDDVRVEPR